MVQAHCLHRDGVGGKARRVQADAVLRAGGKLLVLQCFQFAEWH
jgi:hypothetical protein